MAFAKYLAQLCFARLAAEYHRVIHHEIRQATDVVARHHFWIILDEQQLIGYAPVTKLTFEIAAMIMTSCFLFS